MSAMASQITSLDHDCLLNRLFRHRSKKTSKLRVTGLCAGNSPVTGEFHAQRASNAVNVSIWWRHHGLASDVSFHATDNKIIQWTYDDDDDDDGDDDCQHHYIIIIIIIVIIIIHTIIILMIITKYIKSDISIIRFSHNFTRIWYCSLMHATYFQVREDVIIKSHRDMQTFL